MSGNLKSRRGIMRLFYPTLHWSLRCATQALF
jgi:hypothetical protein